jgi:hypothetical protein
MRKIVHYENEKSKKVVRKALKTVCLGPIRQNLSSGNFSSWSAVVNIFSAVFGTRVTRLGNCLLLAFFFFEIS